MSTEEASSDQPSAIDLIGRPGNVTEDQIAALRARVVADKLDSFDARSADDKKILTAIDLLTLEELAFLQAQIRANVRMAGFHNLGNDIHILGLYTNDPRYKHRR